MTIEACRAEQVEKNGAAAEEWLEVAAEVRRIEPAECGQQLTLAAGPLEQRADWAREARSSSFARARQGTSTSPAPAAPPSGARLQCRTSSRQRLARA